jgi:hypothetical protein
LFVQVPKAGSRMIVSLSFFSFRNPVMSGVAFERNVQFAC